MMDRKSYEERLNVIVEALQDLDCSQEEFEHYYNDLLDCLKENYFQIVFIKANGEEREMNCTRNPEFISKYYSGPERTKEEREIQLEKDMTNNLVRIFDMDKTEFRSFKLDRLISIELID